MAVLLHNCPWCRSWKVAVIFFHQDGNSLAPVLPSTPGIPQKFENMQKHAESSFKKEHSLYSSLQNVKYFPPNQQIASKDCKKSAKSKATTSLLFRKLTI